MNLLEVLEVVRSFLLMHQVEEDLELDRIETYKYGLIGQ